VRITWQIYIYVLCLACGIGAFLSIRSGALKLATEQKRPSAIEEEKHKVSPEMLRDAEALEQQNAFNFHASASDGQTYVLADELKHGPVVLVFIKDGCPCSVSAEIHFNDLHAAYRGHVRFFGVIDGDRDLATAWSVRNAVPFPILLDPQGELVRQYRAPNSAYLALVDTRGKIDSFWPGYSSAMLEALNARIATLSGRPEPTIDTSQAPAELYSGCPFLSPSPRDLERTRRSGHPR
jgi:peroxiredoxin